jgi:phospholipid/cholesterol/gamma-HCH transport system substrate-binding protein
MKKINNFRPIIVGIFIFLGLAILVITIFTLGGQKKTFVRTFTINAIFNDVSGLQTGANILFSGVKIGTVKKISFYGDSQVQIAMNIELSAEEHIHKDAKVKIGSDGLIGNKIVIIYGGNPKIPQVEKNDFLLVEKTTSTDDMLATLQENNKNILEITKDFKNISKKIDSGQGTLATLINDPTIAQKLNASVDNLKETLVNFKKTSEGSKNVLANLEDFSRKLNKKGNSINDLASDTMVYKSVKATLAELNQASNSVTVFTENLRIAGNKLNQNNNTVGVLLNDPASAEAVKTTLKNLETSSKKLDEDLEALQHNFLLRRFFKRKAKTTLE